MYTTVLSFDIVAVDEINSIQFNFQMSNLSVVIPPSMAQSALIVTWCSGSPTSNRVINKAHFILCSVLFAASGTGIKTIEEATKRYR